MNDDTLSVCSSGSKASTGSSTAQDHSPCPYCNKDFQKKSLFRHIRTKHLKEFLDNCNNLKENTPLRVSYEIQDDRGETDYVIFYACLASNKTFLTEARAIQSWKKNPELKKLHNKQIEEVKKLKKEFQKAAKSEKEDYTVRLAKAKTSNDPELCLAIWTNIEFTRNLVLIIVDRLKYLNPDDLSIDCSSGAKYERMTVEQSLKLFEETEKDYNRLKQDRCLTYLPLNDLWIRYQRIFAFRREITFDPILFPKTHLNYEGYDTPNDQWGLTHSSWSRFYF